MKAALRRGRLELPTNANGWIRESRTLDSDDLDRSSRAAPSIGPSDPLPRGAFAPRWIHPENGHLDSCSRYPGRNPSVRLYWSFI